MFGFGKRKGSDPPEKSARRNAESRERKSQNLAQLGFLAGVGDDGDIDNLMGNMDVGDDDLEEELAMLMGGGQAAPPRRPKPSPTKRPVSHVKPKAAANPSFENEDDVDEDDDVDLDDPELEAELGDILGVPTSKSSTSVPDVGNDDDTSEETSASTPAPTMSKDQLTSLLQERLQMYDNAKRAAESAGDSAKSRRFARGFKTLNELLSKAKSGRVVDEADIPPALSLGAATVKKEIEPPPEIATSQPLIPNVPTLTPTNDVIKHVELPPAPKPLFDDNMSSQNKLPAPLIPTPVHTGSSPESSAYQGKEETAETSNTVVDPAVDTRLKEYKRAAVALKRQGDVQGAVKYLKLSKALESAVKSGENIDLSNYPDINAVFNAEQESSDQATVTPSPASDPQPSQQPPTSSQSVDPTPTTTADPSSDPQQDIFGAPPPPTSVMEALVQRLDKYKSEVEKASAASNSSKARRMGRIVKQYEEAIMFHKKGKPVPFEELPTPPGFAPIPAGGFAAAAPAVTPAPKPPAPLPSESSQPSNPPDAQSGTPGKRPKTDSTSPSTPQTGTSPGTSGSTISRSGKPVSKLTLQEKQLQMITLRQQQFKEAALNAKKRGDLNQAREFLRTAKGFDKLIEVAQMGLPVDMATLPVPPEAVTELDHLEDDNFEVVSASDCIMPADGDEVFSKLETDLKQQLKMCMRTRDHFKSIGDVGSANRFETMALESKRDLDALRLAMKRRSEIPKYHYENRIFSITECNTDVGEDEIEVSIIQGINYKVSNPSDVDTFVKIELPYPSAEEVQTNKTSVVKDTNNPQYNATYKMAINRTARNFQRFVHRHGFKCEVWSKGGLCSGGFFFCKCNSGFLRGNTLIGTATVKILPLETKCTLHDAFEILDGRKVVGKLEVKVRIREPVLTKQITQKKEKWLSIDRA